MKNLPNDAFKIVPKILILSLKYTDWKMLSCPIVYLFVAEDILWYIDYQIYIQVYNLSTIHKINSKIEYKFSDINQCQLDLN